MKSPTRLPAPYISPTKRCKHMWEREKAGTKLPISGTRCRDWYIAMGGLVMRITSRRLSCSLSWESRDYETSAAKSASNSRRARAGLEERYDRLESGEGSDEEVRAAWSRPCDTEGTLRKRRNSAVFEGDAGVRARCELRCSLPMSMWPCRHCLPRTNCLRSVQAERRSLSGFMRSAE